MQVSLPRLTHFRQTIVKVGKRQLRNYSGVSVQSQTSLATNPKDPKDPKRSISLHNSGSNNSSNKSNSNIMCGAASSNSCNDNKSNPNNNESIEMKQEPIIDIEEIHTIALQSKSKTYIDPKTGFTVFTEFAHLKRGKCCGNVCRHCPYGWENVSYRDNKGKVVRKEAKVKSGDVDGVKKLLEDIDCGNVPLVCSSKITMDDADGCDHEVHDEADKEPESNVDLDDNNDQINDEPKKEEQRTLGKGGRKGGTYTSKNVPYTRTGDEGTSVLLTGERRSKDDIVFEAMGTVDELCSVVGVAHAELVANIGGSEVEYGDLEDWLLESMSRLFDVGSHVAKPKKTLHIDDNDDSDSDDEDTTTSSQQFTADGIGGGFSQDHILTIEEWIDKMTDELPELTSFILPTGGKLSSQLHVARCVCRRAERRVLPLVRDEGVCDPNVVRYLNRLSDFFFTAARYGNYCEGKDELQYRRYFKGSKQRGMVKTSLDRVEKKES